MTGYAPEELEGKPFHELKTLYPEALPYVTKFFQDLMGGQNVEDYELEVRHKDGTKRWVCVKNRVLRSNGKVEGILVLARDLSDRKKILPETDSFLQTSADNVVVTALTQSVDRKGYLLRYYEAADRDGAVEVKVGPSLACASAKEVNLVETPVKDLEVKENAVTAGTVGFEIKTLKLKLSRPKPKK